MIKESLQDLAFELDQGWHHLVLTFEKIRKAEEKDMRAQFRVTHSTQKRESLFRAS